MKHTSVVAGMLLLLWAVELKAQGSAPKPGPEHRKMEAWLGSWIWTYENKGSPDPQAPPAGKCTLKEKDEMLGGFFVIRQVDGECNGLPEKVVSIMRWDASRKAYVLSEFNNHGAFEDFTIAQNGPEWSLVDVGTAGGQKYWHRCSWTFNPNGTRIAMKCVDSKDGKSWTVTGEGQWAKAAANAR